MIKPRCGFYITEKFPKIPKYLHDGDWEVSIPYGAVVIYDMNAFVNSGDEELLRYCQDLIEHFGLDYEPKHLLDLVAFTGIMEALPKDKERAKEVIRQTPGIELEEDGEDNA